MAVLRTQVLFCVRTKEYSQATDRGHSLVLTRDPVFLLVFVGVRWFSFVSLRFSLVFLWFSESVFLLAVSLDSGVTVLDE